MCYDAFGRGRNMERLCRIMPDTRMVVLKQKRLEKFHGELKQFCRKRSVFRNNIQVDMRHISSRAAETGHQLRRSITNEHIAAIVLAGQINVRSSREVSPMEIVLEGKFLGFPYVDWDTGKDETIDCVCVKVVIREKRKGKKHLVVTVYPDDSLVQASLPEVDFEIW